MKKLILAAVVLAFGLAPFVDAPHLMSRLFDDAFYYFTIARHVAHGEGFTFDGIHATNGFHPAWLFVCVAVTRVFADPVTALRVFMILQAALFGGAVIAMYRVLSSRIGELGALCAALTMIALPGALLTFQSGMEASLLLLAWVMLWRAWADDESAWQIGAWASALFWIRLEMIVVVAVLIALRRGKNLVALALPSVISLALYLTWNRLAFGTWLSVSGMTKQAIAAHMPMHVWISIPWVGQALLYRVVRENIVWISGGALLVMTAVGVWQRVRLSDWFTGSGTRVVVVTALVVAVVQKLAVGMLYNWYEVPVFLLTAIAIGVIASRVRVEKIVIAVLLLAIARYPFKVFMQRDVRTIENTYILDAVAWIDAHTPTDARIGSWNAGAFAWFSTRHIVNLDGLVNDREFHDRVVVRGEWEAYLRDEEIDWLVDGAWIEHAKPTDCVTELYCTRISEFVPVAKFLPPSNDGDIGQAVWRRR